MPPRVAAARMMDAVKHNQEEPDHQVRLQTCGWGMVSVLPSVCTPCFDVPCLCRMFIRLLQTLMHMIKLSVRLKLYENCTNDTKHRTSDGTTTPSSLDLFALLGCCLQSCIYRGTHTSCTKFIQQLLQAFCPIQKRFLPLPMFCSG